MSYVALGQMPDLSALSTPECQAGLGRVPVAAEQQVHQGLQAMVFMPTGPEGAQYGGISGEASYLAGSGGDPWVADLVNMGLVVLVEYQPTQPTGSVHVIATAVPASIRELAGCPHPRYLIVDGHPAALAAAEAVPEPVPNGEPEPELAPPVAEAKTETVTLLIVGGAVLLVGAAFGALVTRR